MQPSSPTFGSGGLNENSAVSSQLATVPNQFDLHGSLDNYSGIWVRGTTGNRSLAAFISLARDFVAATYLGAYVYYSFYDDPTDFWWITKQENAGLWYYGALALIQMDAQWCQIIGADVDVLGYPVGCAQSDGIVPEASALLPTANTHIILVDVSHVELTTSTQTLARLSIILEGLGVQRLTAVAPLAVSSMAGPTSTSALAEDAFSVSVTGGTPPYSITWSVDGVVRQTGEAQSFAFTNTGNDYFISVRVVDYLGAAITQSRSVTVVNCGGAFYC